LVFIECLTGQTAITGASLAEVFHKQLSQSNVPIPAAIAGHPVAGLLRRVLNKKAAERVEDAKTLYEQLSQLNLSTLVGKLVEPTNRQLRQPALLSATMTQTLTSDQRITESQFTERKQITVLCLSLAIKVVNDAAIDHEVIQTLHQDQKSQCQDIAIRFGAFHVGTLGNQLLFYYGYPITSDNDCRLAARTALEITSEMAKRNELLLNTQGIQTRARMGINTGMVMTYADNTPEGETADVAIELALLASPRQILCDEITRAKLDAYITFQPAGAAAIGMEDQTTALYALTAERQTESFGFLRANRKHNSFVGRQEQLAQLLSVVTQPSHTNKGPVAHVYGEAGIGKSRLIFELRDQTSGALHCVGQCLPEHRNNALYPVLNILKYRYALDTLPPEQAVIKLSDSIASLADPKLSEALPVLCFWLSLPLPEHMSAPTASPDKQKKLLFNSLSALLCSRPSHAVLSTVFVFEDLHWMDPTSIEFIDVLINSDAFKSTDSRFISTSREPLPQAWRNNLFQQILLTKLALTASQQFVFELFDKQEVSEELMDVVVSRTDGIPLFIEELVDMLQKQRLVDRINGQLNFLNPDQQALLPNTLRDSLQQKLDTLGYAKETAQLAATIGRTFDGQLLLAASNHSSAQLQSDLAELVTADLVILQRQVSGDKYIFKHALVRDAAYDSMGRSSRLERHHRVAFAMVEQDSQDNEERRLIADHFYQSEHIDDALSQGIEYVGHAVSYALSSQNEAYLTTLQQWNRQIADERQQLKNERKINDLTYQLLIATAGYGSKAVEKVASRNREIVQMLGADAEPDQQGIMQQHTDDWNQLQMHLVRSERADALRIAQKLVSDARRDNDRRRLVDSLSMLAICLTTDGRIDEALVFFRECLSIYDPEQDTSIAEVNGADPRCQALTNMAVALAIKKQFDEAKEALSQAMVWANRLDHLLSKALSFVYNCIVLAIADERGLLKAEEALQREFFEQYPELKHLYSFSNSVYDWLEGGTQLQQQFSDYRLETNQTFMHSLFQGILAKTYKEQGDIQQSKSIVTDALDWAHQSGELAFIDFLHEI
ncbi:MAG: AAA family ATPase, partial [Psychrosphaera sp.]|nr:AAA family ATPase [Psychrosphaera sp.]